MWGELAEYTIVEPTTKEERREAHLAAQALKESRPQESTTPSPQVQVPVQDAKTPTTSNTMDDAPVGQTVNPFGEQNNPIASAPRKRGRPCGTTKQAQANSTTCNPIGRPRKEAPQGQTDGHGIKQSNLNPATNPQPQDDHKKIHACQQYINEPAIHEPPVSKVYQDLEEHSHTGVPSQY